MDEYIKRQDKVHYEILLNGEPVKIFRYRERFLAEYGYIDKLKNIHLLHLETNIDEHDFNEWNKKSETTSLNITSKSGIWKKEYICEYLGGIVCYTPFYHKYTYRIIEKKLANNFLQAEKLFNR